jgi:hypothetical protein
MLNTIWHGKTLARLTILLLSSIILIINFSGCTTIYRNYLDQKIDSAADVEKAITTRGEINVILAPGCAARPGAQDTLFSCLKLSRDVNPESVKLPPDEKLYLGHVAEFILRSFKYYQLQESFKDFYGYRIVLKFRKLTPQELRSKKFTDYSRFAISTTSMVAGAATMTPLGIIVFLVDGITMEIDRRDFEDRVARMDLPTPKKNIVTLKLESGGRTLLYAKDEIAQELTGKNSARIQFDDKVTSYMAEECVLEKVTPEDMNLYQEQIKLFKKHDRSPSGLLKNSISD